MAASGEDGDGPASTKVGRLIEEYGLGEGYGASLEAAWTADPGERTSLRDLADEFNRDLLAAAMEDAGASVIDGEVDNLFRLLTSDEVTAGARSEARSRLGRAGVDVERLEGDFVTYQAIRSYLQNERDAEYEGADADDRVERTAESIGRLQSRIASVSENNLDQLRETDALTLGTFRLFASIDVLCEDCDSQYSAIDLLERGGCDCQRAEDPEP